MSMKIVEKVLTTLFQHLPEMAEGWNDVSKEIQEDIIDDAASSIEHLLGGE